MKKIRSLFFAALLTVGSSGLGQKHNERRACEHATGAAGANYCVSC
jgi:hypothetical protein